MSRLPKSHRWKGARLSRSLRPRRRKIENPARAGRICERQISNIRYSLDDITADYAASSRRSSDQLPRLFNLRSRHRQIMAIGEDTVTYSLVRALDRRRDRLVPVRYPIAGGAPQTQKMMKTLRCVAHVVPSVDRAVIAPPLVAVPRF